MPDYPPVAVRAYLSLALLQVKHASMHGLPLLEGRPQRAMQSVLEVELSAPRHDVREQVAVEG